MNADERFEYMAEQFYKKTGMLAPGKDDAIPRSDEYKRKASCAWGIFTEKFYSNLFQTHADMYEMLEKVVQGIKDLNNITPTFTRVDSGN